MVDILIYFPAVGNDAPTGGAVAGRVVYPLNGLGVDVHVDGNDVLELLLLWINEPVKGATWAMPGRQLAAVM